MSRPGWIAGHPDGALLEGLLAVAWADGAITVSEREALDALLDALEVEASPEERAAWRERRPDPDAVAEAVGDPLARRFLLDRALQLGLADGEVAAEEEALVARWAARWGVSDAELEELRAEVQARLGGA